MITEQCNQELYYPVCIILNTSLLYALLLGCGGGYSRAESYDQKADLAKSEPSRGTDPNLISALQLIEKMPDAAAGYNQLAVHYIRAARRTGDFGLNAKAEAAVEKALEKSPGDILARKLHASLQLTLHRFDKALELGTQLKNEFPKDAFVYGVLTDANAELGNYDEAKANAQQMVDLRPDSSSYARVAHIRSLFGNHEGAVEM